MTGQITKMICRWLAVLALGGIHLALASDEAVQSHMHHHATAVSAGAEPVAASMINGLSGVSVDFELQDARGMLVSSSDYRGKYMLVGFGFTRCAHVCPVMAANMARVLRETRKETVGIFVSVDTERDTPLTTHNYAVSFNEAMIGLGGSYEQIANAANNFKISYAVTKTQQSYTVQHTSNIYLIDPDGKLLDLFPLNADADDIVSAMN